MAPARAVVRPSIATPGRTDCTCSILASPPPQMSQLPRDTNRRDWQTVCVNHGIIERVLECLELGPTWCTFNGSEWAENNRITSFRLSLGNSSSSLRMLSANVFTSRGCVAHRSTTLHLIFVGRFLNENDIDIRAASTCQWHRPISGPTSSGSDSKSN